MKRRIFSFANVTLILLFHFNVFADVEVREWIGDYNMNLDGRAGTLKIEESKADCATSKWCSMGWYNRGLMFTM